MRRLIPTFSMQSIGNCALTLRLLDRIVTGPMTQEKVKEVFRKLKAQDCQLPVL